MMQRRSHCLGTFLSQVGNVYAIIRLDCRLAGVCVTCNSQAVRLVKGMLVVLDYPSGGKFKQTELTNSESDDCCFVEDEIISVHFTDDSILARPEKGD